MVEIRVSNIDGANQGLFARQDIEINTVLAFYNGTKARPEDYEPDTWETNNYKIFDPDDMPDGTIDIPVWAQVTMTDHHIFIFLISFSYLSHIFLISLSFSYLSYIFLIYLSFSYLSHIFTISLSFSYLSHIFLISFSYLYDQDTSAYCASLAHKTNHSFLPNCQFLVFDHPKFGLVSCISTIADINKGDEVRRNSRLLYHRYLPSLLSHLSPPVRSW